MKERPILFKGAMVRALLAGTKTQTRRLVNPQPVFEASGLVPNLNDYLFKGARLNVGGTDLPDACPQGTPGDRLWVKETHRFPAKANPRVRVDYQADMSSWGIADAHNITTNEVTLNAKLFPGPANEYSKQHWRPSIFMYRWASRIDLDVTAVRVERLNDISEADAIAEGIIAVPKKRESDYQFWRDYRLSGDGTFCVADPVSSYRSLWNSINLKPGAIEVRNESGKREAVGYTSTPWSLADFDAAYPGARSAGSYHGKPLTVTANPWVWVITFKRVQA